MQCPSCGTENAAGATTCVSCGRALRQTGTPAGAQLIWTDDDVSRTIALNHALTIGRTAGNDIVVPDSAISRQHARIEVGADGITVVDLGSLNGVLVNGERIGEPRLLGDGDVVKVGRSEFTVQLPVRSTESTVDEALPEPPDEDEQATMMVRFEEESEATMMAPGIDEESEDDEHTVLQPLEADFVPAAPAPPQPAGFLVSPDGERIPIITILTIGRVATNDISVPNDQRMSRQHASLEVRDGEVWVTDAGSANGSFLNDERLTEPVLLADGDEVRFGLSEYRFEAAQAPAAPAAAPPAATPVYEAPAFEVPVYDDAPIWQAPRSPEAAIDAGAAHAMPAVPTPEARTPDDFTPAETTSGGGQRPITGETFISPMPTEQPAPSRELAPDEDDSDEHTLQGTAAELYIRQAELAEFDALRRGDTDSEPALSDATDQYRLVINFGPEAGKQFLLSKDAMVIGRAADGVDYDIVLNDRAASRPHARFLKVADGYVVEDMDSANGTWVNYTEEITQPRHLIEGDIVKVGKTTLVYRVPASIRPEHVEPLLDPEVGQIITCFSLKGGVGTTSMAVNLAVVIRQLTNQPVLLIDLSIERGAISVHLNLAPRLTLADLPTDAGSIDYDSIQTLITHHSTGIDVLAAPPTPQTAELVTAGAVSAMLPLMRQLYKWVVLDTTGTFSELNLGVFDQSDLFVVLCAPDLTSLKVTQATLDVFDALSISGDKRVLALNQIFPTSFLQREDLERTMGERIAVVVPYGGSALLDAADHGVPLVIGHPDSPAANAIRSFAEQLANVKATVQVEQKRGGLGKWVQGMLGSLRR